MKFQCTKIYMCITISCLLLSLGKSLHAQMQQNNCIVLDAFEISRNKLNTIDSQIYPYPEKATIVHYFKLKDTLLLDLNFVGIKEFISVPIQSALRHKTPIFIQVSTNPFCEFTETFTIRIDKVKRQLHKDAGNPADMQKEKFLDKINSLLDPISKQLPELSDKLVDADTLDALDTRKESTRNIVVIDKKDFEKFGFFTAGEVLRTLPGVYFEDVSENSLPQMRGAPVGYTQLLIDGERLPDGNEMRAMQVDRIPAAMIERIEVIRSPDAMQDAQGMAGTINIILKKSNQTPRNQLNLSYGSNYTKGEVFQGSLVNDLQYGKWRITPKTVYQKRGNGKDKYKRQFSATKNDKLEDDLREMFYTEFSFMPEFRLNLKNKQQLTISPLLLFSEGEGYRRKSGEELIFNPALGSDTVSLNNQEEEFSYRKRNTIAIRANYAHKINKHLQMNASANFAKTNQVIDIEKAKLFDLDILNTSNRNIDSVGDYESLLRAELVYSPFRYLKSTVRTEGLYKARQINRRKSIAGFEDNIKIEELYLLREFRTNLVWNNQFSFKKASLNAGLRGELLRSENTVYTNYITDFMVVPKPISKEGRATNVDPFLNFNYKLNLDFLSKITGEILQKIKNNARDSANKHMDGFKDKLKKHQKGDWVLKPNVTRSVKRPDFADLNPFVEYRDGTFINPDRGGNPNLKPEQSWNFDLSTEYYIAKKKGVIGLNYYQRVITQMIARGIEIDPWSERFTSRPVNVGNGTMSGFELDFNYKVDILKNYKLTSRGNYTRPKSALKDPKTGERKSFKNQPDYFFNLGFDLSTSNKSKWTIGCNYNHYPGFTRENFKLDGTFTEVFQLPIYRIDTYTGFNPIKNMSIRVSAHNFLRSQKYKEENKRLSDGAVNESKIDQEIYRPVYNVCINYNF
jgi:outer membrane receptor for ferrienterochelin and colicins